MLIPVLYLTLSVGLLTIFFKVVVPLRSLLLRRRCCPRCGATHSLTRSPRRKLDRLLSRVIDCRRYKCLTCWWKGLLREIPAEAAYPINAKLPILMEHQKTGMQ